MNFSIDGENFSFHVDSPVVVGDDVVLSRLDDDISLACDWSDVGYVVADFLPQESHEEIRQGISCRMQRILGLDADAGFSLERYHYHCDSDAQHMKVLTSLRYGLPLADFPVDFALLDERISDICGVDVTCAHQDRVAANRFCIRIVRPGQHMDNNPPHRDVWLDRLRQAINIYVPIAGSNGKSSLPLIPGSHRWRESDLQRTAGGARINGVEFSVPCVVSSVHGMEMVRPPVRESQVLVFSPYLVHGGAINLNTDMTRVSLEIRFWRK